MKLYLQIFTVRFFCFVFLSACVHVGYAQKVDSTHHVNEIKAFQYNTSFTQREVVEIDTINSMLYNYAPNAAISDYSLDLASFASPAWNLQFSPLQHTPFYLHGFEKSMYSVDNMQDYSSKQPFSDAFYSVAKNQEQQVKFFHTQNYNKDLNVGIKLNFYKSLGEYKPQTITGKHIAPWITYTGARFTTYFKFAHNAITFDNNGGILIDSLIDKTFITTKLTQANTEIQSQSALFIQKWNLLNSDIIVDSSSIEIPVYPIALGYRLDYNASKKYFTDKKVDESYYPNILFDSLQTIDTTKHKVLLNTVFMEFGKRTDKLYRVINLGVGYEYENCYYRDYNFSYPEIHNTSMLYQGNIEYDVIPQKIAFNHSHTLYFYGNSRSDFSTQTSITKQIPIFSDKKLDIALQYEFEKMQPHCMYSNFMSNHYVWNQNYIDELSQHLSAHVYSSWGKITAKVDYYLLKNYMYFDAFGTITQAQGESDAIVYSITKQTDFWKFSMQNGGVLQAYTTKGIDYPQWATYNSFAFHSKVYKNLIDCKIGVEGLLYPKFYVPQYNTSLSVYTMQHTTKIGDYPHVNAFLAVKYKPIRFVIKYNGLYSQFVEKNFTALHYPQQSGYVTFAVSWLFYN